MSRKKQEAALQAEIESQEEWEEMMGKEGLTGTVQLQQGCSKAMSGLSRSFLLQCASLTATLLASESVSIGYSVCILQALQGTSKRSKFS